MRGPRRCRAAAAAWYAEHLGFEAVEAYEFWAKAVDGGPLQISADGGQTMLALFEASEGHPMIPQQTGVAFSVDFETFSAFTRSLPGDVNGPTGQPLVADDVIHSFWVPDFVTKRDLIPGIDNEIDVNLTETGTFPGRCAEFCGLEHWAMQFSVESMTPEDFDAWLADAQAAEQPIVGSVDA